MLKTIKSFFAELKQKFTRSTPTATTPESTEERIELLLSKNKLEVHALECDTLCTFFVKLVILRAITPNRKDSRPVLVLTEHRENIFLTELGLQPYLQQSLSSATTGTTALTGCAGPPGLWYAYFETLDYGVLCDLTMNYFFDTAALCLYFWPSPDKRLSEVLAESEAIWASWCQLNSPNKEVSARIDHSYELVGVIADAAWLVWTNPCPFLLEKTQSSDQNPDQTTAALSSKSRQERTSRLLEHLLEEAELSDLVVVNIQSTID